MQVCVMLTTPIRARMGGILAVISGEKGASTLDIEPIF